MAIVKITNALLCIILSNNNRCKLLSERDFPYLHYLSPLLFNGGEGGGGKGAHLVVSTMQSRGEGGGGDINM